MTNHSGTARIVVLSGEDLTIADVLDIVSGAKISVKQDLFKCLSATRKIVDEVIAKKIPAYGINTGIGNYLNKLIPQDKIVQFQYTMLREHATRKTTPDTKYFDHGILCAAWAILINGFLKGNGLSPASPELVQKLVELTNKRRFPLVEKDTSTGIADLISLAQMSKLLVDEKFPLKGGEALALMSCNALTMTWAIVILSHYEKLINVSTIVGALCIEATRANPWVFSETAMKATQNKYKNRAARDLQFLLSESKLWQPGFPGKIQHFLALRTIHDVIGSAWNAMDRVKQELEVGINSYQGNPLVDIETKNIIPSTGFDTTQLTAAMDAMRRGISEVICTLEIVLQKICNGEHCGLSCGLSTDSDESDDLYRYNLTGRARAARNNMAIFTNPVDDQSYGCELAVGQEDRCPAFPQTAELGEQLIPYAKEVITICGIVAARAITLHINLKHISIENLSPRLQELYSLFDTWSPQQQQKNVEYDLGPAIEIMQNSRIILEICDCLRKNR